MKVGKHIKLNEYENIKLSYGTIDQLNLKTIYLEMNSWIEPKNNIDYYPIIYNTKRGIKEKIRNEQNDLFKKECIIDIDIKLKSIKEGKRSFMSTQITLFTNDFFNIKGKNIKNYMQNLSQNIIKEYFADKKLYNFYKTKK